MTSNIKVAVRIKPENDTQSTLVVFPENQVGIKTRENQQELKSFTFDFLFDSASSQEKIYQEAITELLEKFQKGFNATVLAYGQTGSGKTHTIGIGGEHDPASDRQLWGIVPRAVQDIFAFVERQTSGEYQVSASFLELYNEELLDLLDRALPKSGIPRPKPTLREDAAGNTFVANIVEEKVLHKGTRARTTASTEMNETSSRSHAIFTITLKQSRAVQGGGKIVTNSKFNFVDLAGSERLKKTFAEGDRKKEGISINQGLLALGNVISALGDESRKASHVPYRDSKLTRLLQESLGGNSQTLMIACVSSLYANSGESLATLNYANRARNIQNKVVINQEFGADGAATHKEIKALQETILQLQSSLEAANANAIQATEAQLELTEKLIKADKKVKDSILDAERMLHARNEYAALAEKTKKTLQDVEADAAQKAGQIAALQERTKILESDINQLILENKKASEMKVQYLQRLEELSSEKAQVWQEKASVVSQYTQLRQLMDQLETELAKERSMRVSLGSQLVQLEHDVQSEAEAKMVWKTQTQQILQEKKQIEGVVTQAFEDLDCIKLENAELKRQVAALDADRHLRLASWEDQSRLHREVEDELIRTRDTLESTLQAFDAQKLHHLEMERQSLAFTLKIQDLEDQVAQLLRENRDYRNTYESLNVTIADLQAKAARHEADAHDGILEWKEKASNDAARIRELEEKCQVLSSDYHRTLDEKESIQTDIAVLQSDLAVATKDLLDARSATEGFQLTMDTMVEKGLLEELNAKLASAESQLGEATMRQTSLSDQLKDAQLRESEQHRRSTVWEQERTALVEQLEQQSATFAALKDALEEKTTQMLVLQKEIDSLRAATEVGGDQPSQSKVGDSHLTQTVDPVSSDAVPNENEENQPPQDQADDQAAPQPKRVSLRKKRESKARVTKKGDGGPVSTMAELLSKKPLRETRSTTKLALQAKENLPLAKPKLPQKYLDKMRSDLEKESSTL
ncbi:Kinesin-like protein kif21b [Kappamyces sp. JEL0680]|nr:Kinesin-like protein kif21b [Kappamyces sp. JEL0680]